MNEELNQLEKNKASEIVRGPKNKNVVGTKWIFKNKLNEYEEAIINKERLALQCICSSERD